MNIFQYRKLLVYVVMECVVWSSPLSSKNPDETELDEALQNVVRTVSAACGTYCVCSMCVFLHICF